jgi:bifunctional non-homologous end joining protein LigD
MRAAPLRSRSCILDGEAVACGDDGIPLFELVRRWRNGGSVFLYAFDLIELNGNDLRREPLERRKATLARLLARAGHGVQLNEHLEAEGPSSLSTRPVWAWRASCRSAKPRGISQAAPLTG